MADYLKNLLRKLKICNRFNERYTIFIRGGIKMNFRSRKVLIITIVVLFVIAAAAAGYAIFLNKTPKELYFSSEMKTFKSTVKEIQARYKDDLALRNSMAQGPFRTNLEISGDLNANDSVSGYASDQLNTVKETLKESKLTISTASDPLQQITDTVVSFTIKGSELLNAELFLAQEKMGVKVPVLYDKYFQINPDNFGEAMRKIDENYSGPEKLDPGRYSFGNLNREKEDWTKTGLRYAEFFKNNLPEEYFRLEKDVLYNSPDGQHKLRQLTLKMNEDQTKDFFNKLIDRLINDNELQKLMTGNLTDGTLEPEFKNNLEELKTRLQNIRFPDGLTMVILINDKENIVSRQFNLSLLEAHNDTEDGLNIKLDSNKWDSKGTHKTSSLNLVVEPAKEEDSALKLSLNSNLLRGKKEITHQFIGSCILTDEGRKAGDITLKYNSSAIPEKNGKRQSQSDFELLSSGNFSIPALQGKINRVVDQNLKKKYSHQDLIINLTTGTGESNRDGKIDLSLNLKNNIEFIDNFPTPSLNASNSVDLDTINQDELNAIMAEVKTSWNKIYSENHTLLDLF
jgi:hypothetical protein